MKVKVDRLGMNGEGICKIPEGENKDKICFVPFSLPGELIDVDIVHVKKKFCEGCLQEIIEKSSNRHEPECPYFGKCGGCDLQHMDKPLQKYFKTNNVKNTLIKEIKKDIEVQDVVRVNDFAYRNKMVFPVADINGKIKIGMFQSGSHNIIEIDNCIIAQNILNNFLKLSKKYFENSKFKGYNFKTKQGDIKYLVARCSKDNLLVTVVATKDLDLRDFFETLSNSFKNIGLSIIISNRDDEILSGVYKHLFGMRSLDIDEYGIKYSVDNRGFLQVNDEMKSLLYSKILDLIDEDSCVIDAYSGAGLLSSILAKKCKRVVGIEINKSASSSAKELVSKNNIKNIEFVNDDVKDSIEKVLDNFNDCVVVLDPPRSGCDGRILQILNQRSNTTHGIKNSSNKGVFQIIYVSCNPATLARDLKILAEAFEIKSIEPLDMFPQTKHVETLVVMRRKDKYL